MGKRAINSWGTHQDAYVDSVLGYSLIGNICGRLSDLGHSDLATDIKQAIAEHNNERGPRDH